MFETLLGNQEERNNRHFCCCSVAKYAPPSDRSAAGESLAEIKMKMGVLYEWSLLNINFISYSHKGFFFFRWIFFYLPYQWVFTTEKNPLKSLKFTFCQLLFMVGKVQAPTDGVRSTTILLSLWRMQFSDLQAAESSCCWETPRFSDAGCGSDAPLPCQGLDFPWCPVHMEAIESAVPSIAAESSPASIRFQGPPAHRCELSPNSLRRTCG